MTAPNGKFRRRYGEPCRTSPNISRGRSRAPWRWSWSIFRSPRSSRRPACRPIAARTFWKPIRPGSENNLSQNVLDHFAVDIRQAEVPALELVGQAQVVHAEAAQHGRLQVVNVHGIGDHVVAVVVRLANTQALLDAA